MSKDVFSSNPIRLHLVAPDGRLARSIRVLDSKNRFATTRFATIDAALHKSRNDLGVVLLVQCSYDDLSRGIEALTRFGIRFFSSRLFVYVPDLPERTTVENEDLRLALLEIGVTAVFAQRRELASLLSVFERYAARFPAPSKEYRSVREFLPWNAAAKID